MLTFRQSTGELDLNGKIFAAHSGRGEGLNNSAMENVEKVGPIPKGWYSLGSWLDGSAYSAADARLGPFVSRLTPDPGNEMYGRSGFFIHGGDGSNPPTDSEGCIVTFRSARQAIASAGETRLQVIP